MKIRRTSPRITTFFASLSLSISLLISLSACGGGGGSSAPEQSPQPTNNSSAAAISSSSSTATSSSSSSTSTSSSSSSAKPVAEEKAELEIISEYHDTHSIGTLVDCGQKISLTASQVNLFGDYDTNKMNQALSGVTGWNHATNGSATEWKGTKLSGTTYNNPSNGKAKEECNGVDTLDIVLVKKVADWDHQHANGFEHHITSQKVTFGQIDSIVIDLKINSSRTSVPTQKNLLDTYSAYTSESNIKNLDHGKVNIGFTLYDGTTLKSADIIEIDQALYADKWIRVTIRADKMTYYSEVNYNRTTKKPEDLSSAIVNGVLVVGETSSGNVLRGNIANWSASVPETFKEMDISFKKIEFKLK